MCLPLIALCWAYRILWLSCFSVLGHPGADVHLRDQVWPKMLAAAAHLNTCRAPWQKHCHQKEWFWNPGERALEGSPPKKETTEAAAHHQGNLIYYKMWWEDQRQRAAGSGMEAWVGTVLWTQREAGQGAGLEDLEEDDELLLGHNGFEVIVGHWSTAAWKAAGYVFSIQVRSGRQGKNQGPKECGGKRRPRAG